MAFNLKNFLFGGTNDPTQNWIRDNNQGNRDLNYERSNAFYSQLNNGGNLDPNSWFNRAGNFAGMQSGLMNQMGNAAGQSPEDMFRQFQGFQPQISNVAGNVADQSMMYQGRQMEDLANFKSRENLRGLETLLGGSGALGTTNGAAMAAMARGSQEPIMNLMAQLGNMRSNNYMNAYQPMADKGYASVLDQMDKYGRAAGYAGQGAGQMASIGAQPLSYLGQQSEQQILAPQMQDERGLFGSLFDAFAGGGANYAGRNAGDWLYNLFGG